MENLIAFLLPTLIDVINRYIKNSDLRFWVSVLVCALVGTGLDYLTGGFSGFDAWAEQVMVVFGIAQLTYGAVYKNSTLQTIVRGQ